MSVEHDGAIESQRIRKKVKETEAAEQTRKQAGGQNNEQQAIAEHVGKKWAADAHIIAKILKDLNKKCQLSDYSWRSKMRAKRVSHLREDASSAAFPEVTYKLRPTSIPPAKYRRNTRPSGSESWAYCDSSYQPV
ncbi:MAG: hypothetical protein ACLPX7_06465 [Xanthobacteraceae bacterium]